MKTKIFVVLVSAFAPVFLSGCSSCSQTEHSEEVAAEVTAAQMEGRRAARDFIHRHWKDSTEIREAYRELRHLRDSVAPHHTADFDSTFFSTLRIVRPEVAFVLEKGRL